MEYDDSTTTAQPLGRAIPSHLTKIEGLPKLDILLIDIDTDTHGYSPYTAIVPTLTLTVLP